MHLQESVCVLVSVNKGVCVCILIHWSVLLLGSVSSEGRGILYIWWCDLLR